MSLNLKQLVNFFSCVFAWVSFKIFFFESLPLFVLSLITFSCWVLNFFLSAQAQNWTKSVHFCCCVLEWCFKRVVRECRETDNIWSYWQLFHIAGKKLFWLETQTQIFSWSFSNKHDKKFRWTFFLVDQLLEQSSKLALGLSKPEKFYRPSCVVFAPKNLR